MRYLGPWLTTSSSPLGRFLFIPDFCGGKFPLLFLPGKFPFFSNWKSPFPFLFLCLWSCSICMFDFCKWAVNVAAPFNKHFSNWTHCCSWDGEFPMSLPKSWSSYLPMSDDRTFYLQPWSVRTPPFFVPFDGGRQLSVFWVTWDNQRVSL